MTQIPTRQTFKESYAGEAPWDIGRIQGAFAAIADQVKSPVLDAGCGTGDIALYLGAKAPQGVGLDYLEEPIRRARAKAAERNLKVDFRVADATKLADLPERFDTALDYGLFHVFTDDDRRKYVAGLAQVLNPGGRVFLMCFSDEEPGQFGPRRITRAELKSA